MQHIFIIGAKSFGKYGGYETFVNKLTAYHQEQEELKYHVACKANGEGSMDESILDSVNIINDTDFIYQGAHGFKIQVPNIGPAQAIYYDVMSLKYCFKYIRENNIKNPIIYILACRIGIFATWYSTRIKQLGGRIYINPDGHEWLRGKWPFYVKKYWKFSECLMVKHADLIVCDSINIEKYICECYKKYNPKTTYIAYGAETSKTDVGHDDPELQEWYRDKGVQSKEYYLVVGRFVPENNYEIMIREFMQCHSKKDFVIITNVNHKFLAQLEERIHFRNDKRIKFVGTVYNQQLLTKIRKNAYAYFHGHEVGGTNPSLLEALGSTDLNLLLDVSFNKEVAEGSAYYWNKQKGNLSSLIDYVDDMKDEEIRNMGIKARERIEDAYSWKSICDKYIEIFKE